MRENIGKRQRGSSNVRSFSSSSNDNLFLQLSNSIEGNIAFKKKKKSGTVGVYIRIETPSMCTRPPPEPHSTSPSLHANMKTHTSTNRWL